MKKSLARTRTEFFYQWEENSRIFNVTTSKSPTLLGSNLTPLIMRQWTNCVCLLAAIFAAFDAAVVVDAATSSSHYYLYDSTCESVGLLDIENIAECEGAAALLGLRDTTVQNIAQTPRFVVAVANSQQSTQLYFSYGLSDISEGETFKVLSRDDVAISPALSPDWLVVQRLSKFSWKQRIGVVPVDSMQTDPTAGTGVKGGNLSYPLGCTLHSGEIHTHGSHSWEKGVGQIDYLTFNEANESVRFSNHHSDAKHLCKREPKKPVLGYPTLSLGWVAGNRYLNLLSIDATTGDALERVLEDDDDYNTTAPFQFGFTPKTLSGYATLQLLPSWLIILGFVLKFIFVMAVMLPMFLIWLIWVIIFAIPVGLYKLGTSRSLQATGERIATHWAYVSAHNPLDQWLGVGVGEAPNRPGRQPVYMGWAENKARYRSNVVQGASLFLIPLVLIQITVMDSTLFNLYEEELVVAPCAYESSFNFTEQDDGSGLSGGGPADSSIVHPLAFRHEGICQAVADGHDCFVTDSDFLLQDSLKNLFSTPFSNKMLNITEPPVLTCTPDGFVNVVDTCDEGDLFYSYVACFKLHEQTPMAWLDGLGIATGVVSLLIYIFDNLDWLFRIGKPEPDSKRETFSALQWCCCMSIRKRRQFFFKGGLVLTMGMFMGSSLSFFLSAEFASVEAKLSSYLAPMITIIAWAVACVVLVGEYDKGSCRFEILTKLFDAYADSTHVDRSGKNATKEEQRCCGGESTAFPNGYWTPESTAKLLANVAPSLSFPDRDKVLLLSGHELTQCLADADEIMAAQKKEDAELLKQLASLQESEMCGCQGSPIVVASQDLEAAEEDGDQQLVARIRKDLAAVHDLFDTMDANADGKVSREELADALTGNAKLKDRLESAGISTDFYVLPQIDANEDGAISFKEFATELLVECRWRLDAQNHGIVSFVAAIKSMPAKVEAYQNQKYPAGSLTFKEVWDATWDGMLTNGDLKSKKEQHWWELGIANETTESASWGAADIGFPEGGIVVFDGNDADAESASGDDNVQF